MRTLLEREGFAARTYASGAAFLRETHPDTNSCLVIDLEMPGMSELDLLEKVRQAGMVVPRDFHGRVLTKEYNRPWLGLEQLSSRSVPTDELVLSIRIACEERAR